MSQPRMQVAFLHSIGWDLRYLIARVTGAPVHVATIYDGVLYEAAFSGMRRVDAAARLARGQWEAFDVPARFDVAAARAAAEAAMGQRYDWWGAIAAWWLGRPAGAGARDRVFCSETAADQLVAAGLTLTRRRTAYYHPRRLRDELAQVWRWPSAWHQPSQT